MMETTEQTEQTETEQPTEEPQSDQPTQPEAPEPDTHPSEPVEAPSTEPPRDTHPNEVRGPIEEQFNMEREELIQQHIEARQTLETEHRQKLADNARAKREALEGAGLTAGGRVPSEHSARLQQ